MDTKRVCVLGLGHIGVPNAVAFATSGYDVVGIDVNEDVVTTLNLMNPPFKEPGLLDALRHVVSVGHFKATNDHKAMQYCDVIVVCVFYSPDDPVSFFNTVRRIGENLRPGHLIVVRSTTKPGTMEKVASILEGTSRLKREDDFFLAYCPERSVEGKVLKENQTLPRIIGGIGNKSTAVAVDFFKRVGKGKIIVVKNTKTAEFLKLMENAWRATRFAYANEVALLAEHWGVDAFEVIKAATRGYPRNDGLAMPGLVGGPCIVKDSRILVPERHNLGIILVAQRINEYVIEHVTDLVERHVEKIGKKSWECKVAVLGLAFKRGSDDVRASPSLTLINKLESKRFTVTAYDPHVDEDAEITDVVKGCDAVVLAINHSVFENLPLERMASLVKPHCAFVDCWGLYEAKEITRLGMIYIRLGRGTST